MTEVTGIDHIYIEVSDMDAAEKFYDWVFVEFRKNRPMISNGLRTTCEVPSSYGVFSATNTFPLPASDNRCSEIAGLATCLQKGDRVFCAGSSYRRRLRAIALLCPIRV